MAPLSAQEEMIKPSTRFGVKEKKYMVEVHTGNVYMVWSWNLY